MVTLVNQILVLPGFSVSATVFASLCVAICLRMKDQFEGQMRGL